MNVGIRRAELHVDGASVTWKLVAGDVEPVGSLDARRSVFIAEHNEIAADGVAGAYCSERMFARLELRRGVPCNACGGVRLGGERSVYAAYGISHVAVNVVSGGVAERKRYGFQAVAQRLFRKFAVEGRRLAAQRQRDGAFVALPGHVGNVGFGYYVVETGYALVHVKCYAAVLLPYRKRHGHFYLELSIAVGHGLSLGQNGVVGLVEVKPPVAETPPQSLLAADSVLHFRALNGHS